MYTAITQSVDVLPFEDSAGLPIADIFAPLLMEEDLKAKERMPKLTNQGGKELKSLRKVFSIGDKPAKRIFLKGEAGCGKTLFCLKMLDSWCQVKQSGQVTDDVLQQCLALFDLVIYIPMRNLKEDVSLVKDMIHQTVSEQCKHLLGKSQIHSLVILDGLDESPAVFRELPSMHGLVSYVLFCTTRPWKLTQLQVKFRSDDKVVQISGLLPSSEVHVIEYVLVNFYKLGKGTQEYKMRFNRYSSMAKSSSMASLVKTPMMLTACCCMWYEEDTHCEQSTKKKGNAQTSFPDTHTSMTHTYLSLVDSMIRRADEKYGLRSIFTKSIKNKCPIALTTFPYIHDFLDTLLPLCRVAYTDLVSDETKLVFQKEEFGRKIGYDLVQLALKVGLISQTKAPGRFHQQNLSINFYHKSVQEFIAAIHLTCTGRDDIRSYCTSLDKVMEVINIITFMIGIDPSFCCSLSKHVTDIANVDADIQQYRRTLFEVDADIVKQLYKAQCGWYKEATYSQALTGDTYPPPIIHVSDIYLDNKTDNVTVRLTEEVMYSNLDNIVSVTLWFLHYPLKKVVQHLPQCPLLSALYITHMSSKEDNDLLLFVIPLLTQLDTIEYFGAAVATTAGTYDDLDDILPVYDESDVKVVKTILQLTQLTGIGLWWVDLGDFEIEVTRDMRGLQDLWLYNVFMSVRSWDKFVSGLLTLQQAVGVKLYITNINDAMVTRILTSPHFDVTYDDDDDDDDDDDVDDDDGGRDEKGRYKKIYFSCTTSHERRTRRGRR